VILWRGDPCDVVHAYLLSLLTKSHGGAFIAVPSELTNMLRGNLSEFISFRIGIEHDYRNLQPLTPANAFQPLSRVSRAGIDLMWLYFAEDAENDFAVLQEVKATGHPALTYATALPKDYEKLFGTDPNLTLHTRLLVAKSEVEYVLKKPELLPRVTALAGASPQASPKIKLLPTLVHDEAAPAPEGALQAVRETIIAAGWEDRNVLGWSVALDHFEARLQRLAMGTL
jgi:hypothetical protein